MPIDNITWSAQHAAQDGRLSPQLIRYLQDLAREIESALAAATTASTTATDAATTAAQSAAVVITQGEGITVSGDAASGYQIAATFSPLEAQIFGG